MRITVSMPSTGVFYAPGLARPVTIEVDQLPKSTADALKALVKRADVLTGVEPIEVTASKQARDGRQFFIRVEDGNKERTLRVAEPLGELKGPLGEFVRMVRDQAQLARSAPQRKADP
jgi:hypothetical protein